MARSPGRCELCGETRLISREHVVPKCFYSKALAEGSLQRITIKACRGCNSGTAADDEHFRNVVAVAGEANAVVSELWSEQISRSFNRVPHGRQRAVELWRLMKPVEGSTPPRHMIFPAQDERVLRSIRKLVRGLCAYHKWLPVMDDASVFADVLRQPIPETVVEDMIYHHADPRIFEYQVLRVPEGSDYHSAWLLRFYERTTFVAMAFRSEGAKAAAFGDFAPAGSN